MKIRHFMGYGCVNAKKQSIVKHKNGTNTIHVLVSGNHECGLRRYDKYDVFNWLLKRFDKTVTTYQCISNVEADEGYDDATKTDTCLYRITYTPNM